jgi:hypothetical protein
MSQSEAKIGTNLSDRIQLHSIMIIGFYPDFMLGRDSSGGIATRYRLDGPRIESRWGQDFQHPSRPALGPAQPPIQWVPGFSQG